MDMWLAFQRVVFLGHLLNLNPVGQNTWSDAFDDPSLIDLASNGLEYGVRVVMVPEMY